MKIPTIILGIILLIGIVGAGTYTSCETYGTCQTTKTLKSVNYSGVNVNNSEFLNGLTSEAFLLTNGSRQLTGDWNTGLYNILAGRNIRIENNLTLQGNGNVTGNFTLSGSGRFIVNQSIYTTYNGNTTIMSWVNGFITAIQISSGGLGTGGTAPFWWIKTPQQSGAGYSGLQTPQFTGVIYGREQGALLINITNNQAGIIILGSITAFEFDNCKIYNETDRTITIENSFCLGSEIAKIKPLTPHNMYKMGEGFDLVAKFEIEVKEDYNGNVWNDMEYYNIKEGNLKIQRAYEIKKLILIPYQKEGFTTICEKTGKIDEKNQTETTKCRIQSDGYTTEYKETWEKIDYKANLKKGNITIGIFTDTRRNDYIEFIPTWFGERLEEYSTWTESMHIGLKAYWQMNETTGTILYNKANNSIYNSTVSDHMSLGEAGIIGNAIRLNQSATSYVSFNDINMTLNWTLSFWINSTVLANDIDIWTYFADADNKIMLYHNTPTQDTCLRARISTEEYIKCGLNISNGGWRHIVLTGWTNSTGWTNTSFYQNGSLEGSIIHPRMNKTIVYNRFGTASLTSTNINYSLDEGAWWNRTISTSEITDLFNGGAGITYEELNIGVLTTLLTPTTAHETESENYSFTAQIQKIGNSNITNATLYIWFSNGTIFGTNYTTLTGVVNTTNLSIDNLQNNNYLWNVKGCTKNDTNHACEWASTNWTFKKNETLRKYCSDTETTGCYLWVNFTNGALPECTVDRGSISSNYYYISSNSSSLVTINCSQIGYATNTTRFNISNGNTTVTMTRNTMKLTFRYINQSLGNVSGYWTDRNTVQNFSNIYELEINVTNMSRNNYTKICYNVPTGGNLTQCTQFYEWFNDWQTQINTNLTIQETTTTNKVYIKVKDYNGNPVNYEQVRIAYSNPTIEGQYHLLGQRYSGLEGTAGETYFYIPDDASILIWATKDGYTAVRIERTITGNDYPITNPLTINTKPSTSDTYNGLTVNTYTFYNENFTTIPLGIYAPEMSGITYKTSYNQLQEYSITLDSEFYIGNTVLTKGIHYCDGCTDDLVIEFYENGDWIRNYTIEYKVYDNTKINEPSGLNTDMLFKLTWIAILLISSILGLIFEGGDEAKGTGGKGMIMFFIGCVIIPLIYYGEFMGLFIIACIWGSAKIYNSWRGE